MCYPVAGLGQSMETGQSKQSIMSEGSVKCARYIKFDPEKLPVTWDYLSEVDDKNSCIYAYIL